jgi:hypothetical protein
VAKTARERTALHRERRRKGRIKVSLDVHVGKTADWLIRLKLLDRTLADDPEAVEAALAQVVHKRPDLKIL